MIKPPTEDDLWSWERLAKERPHGGWFTSATILRLIAEIRRLREQLKPDCVNGCIFKLARKIAEDGK